MTLSTTPLLRRSLLTCALALTGFACDDTDAAGADPEPSMAEPEMAEPESPEPETPEPEMMPVGSCIESDFGATGWSGPAVEDGALALDAETTYRVSTTVLFLNADDASVRDFSSVLGPIAAGLTEYDGLLAWQFGGSATCGAQRTITIWRDAQAMYQFVGSPAHVDAMTISDDISRAAWVTSWESAGADVSTDWDDYRARLGAE